MATVTNIVLLLFFVGRKILQIRFTLRCIQCMATSVLLSEHCMLGVRNVRWIETQGRNLHQILRCNQLAWTAASIVFHIGHLQTLGHMFEQTHTVS